MVSDALVRLCARPIAHRGLHGCGRAPTENSLDAAAAAIAAGYGIECDIQLSADGEAMVFHDYDLARLTDGTGPIANAATVELDRLRLRDRQRIPTLGAFLEAIDGQTPIVIEIKRQPPGDTRLADRALQLARDYRGAVIIESFDTAIVTHCLDADPPCPIGLVGPPEDGSSADHATLARCAFVSWNIDQVASIAAVYPDIPRTTWTVRTPMQAETALAAGAQIVFEGFAPATPR